MSISIKLIPFGKKHQPTYKISVSETKYRRNGKPIEVIGTYNPYNQDKKINLDQQRFEYWLTKGALVTSGIKKLLVKNDPKNQPISIKKTENKKQQKKDK